MKKNTSQAGENVRHDAIRDIAGIGYIIAPKNIDYYEYIRSCLRNSTVTIITDSGEIIKNVLVARNIWQDIDFPKDTNEKGSAVVWLNIPNKNKPVVLVVLNKTNNLNNKNELNSFDFSRENIEIGTSATFTGKGDEGSLDIFLNGTSKLHSKVNFKVLNESELGEFNIYVQGDVEIESENNVEIKLKNKLYFQIIDEENKEKQTNISYELRKGFNYKDEFGNIIKVTETGIDIIDKFNNTIQTFEDGISCSVDENKFSLKKKVVGVKYGERTIKIDSSGITIDASDEDVEIYAGDNAIQMNNSGINIDSADGKVSINGSKGVLYSKIPGLTEIIDVSQIGISKKVKVG